MFPYSYISGQDVNESRPVQNYHNLYDYTYVDHMYYILLYIMRYIGIIWIIYFQHQRHEADRWSKQRENLTIPSQCQVRLPMLVHTAYEPPPVLHISYVNINVLKSFQENKNNINILKWYFFTITGWNCFNFESFILYLDPSPRPHQSLNDEHIYCMFWIFRQSGYFDTKMWSN